MTMAEMYERERRQLVAHGFVYTSQRPIEAKFVLHVSTDVNLITQNHMYFLNFIHGIIAGMDSNQSTKKLLQAFLTHSVPSFCNIFYQDEQFT